MRGRPRKGFLDNLITECGAIGYEMMNEQLKTEALGETLDVEF